ncbi:hypothetical protein [Zoogloea sp.]|uniref:hypothetical protein n=1 Tax=Zoogloea sp. TaxID=49181 RepID=UPI0035B447F0
MMTAQPTLRLCHAGMDSRSLYAFEIFLSRVDTRACQITDEAAADVAFIDIDNDLGRYLLEGHRLLYPGRPLIVSTQKPALHDDPLTIAVTKPVGLAAFSAALERARGLLPPPPPAVEAPLTESPALAPPAADAAQAEPAAALAEAVSDDADNIPDELPVEMLFNRTEPRPANADPVALLRQLEERLSTFYVGSMPDVDLDDPAARAAIYYAPEQFLQGEIARALAHAREIHRPVRIDDASGTALYLDPVSGKALQARSTNAMRALAQLPTRGTVRMSRVDPKDAGRMGALEQRPLEALEWDVALWASRGRLPRGTNLDYPVRLHSWPNLTRLAVPPEAMRIAGLWSRSSYSLRDTVRVLGVPQRYVFAFYSACHALGLVELAATPSAIAAARIIGSRHAAAETAESAAPMRGLFKRILGKLLGARLGEAAAG